MYSASGMLQGTRHHALLRVGGGEGGGGLSC